MRSIQVISFFQFYDILMKMFNYFQIPVKLILRQVHTWSLISTPFDSTSAQGIIAYPPISYYNWFITLLRPISDATLYYLKGCHSLNNQFAVLTLLDWKGDNCIFTSSHTDTLTPSQASAPYTPVA